VSHIDFSAEWRVSNCLKCKHFREYSLSVGFVFLLTMLKKNKKICYASFALGVFRRRPIRRRLQR
jgi:hypothetical protein